jgi:Ni,Fe-hydrogenase III large subunit/Ni,Fe-hydrogenase III component G
MKKTNIIKTYIPDGLEAKIEGNIISYCVDVRNIVQICNKLYFPHKLQLKTITAVDETNDGGWFRILYVFGVPKENIFLVPYVILDNKEEFPSITKDIHEASGYERKIKTFFGLSPVGHPSIQKILLHENWPDTVFPLRKDFDWQTKPEEVNGAYESQKVEGEGIYEIPVGPVHAGIIEPGHFRFSVAGEKIILLKPKLGYKHKGCEKLFEILSMEDKVRLSERISGDTSFTHSMAFCQAIENLSDIEIPERAKYMRVIFSELERFANHISDIGFVMLDAGYNFGGSNCARLREVVMQWNERLTGSRFLRGVNTIGGVTRDIESETARKLLEILKKLHQDFNEVIEVSQNSSSLINRLSGTGKADRRIAMDHGVVGVAGRAIGLKHDARIEYPYAAYSKLKFNIALEKNGDVLARWTMRIKEIHSSMLILEQAILGIPPDKELKSDKKAILRKKSHGIGITEGWRGDIVYLVVTDLAGKVNRVDVRDPSFINWTILEHSINNEIIPDFPLINKSFNLSYSGNDL